MLPTNLDGQRTADEQARRAARGAGLLELREAPPGLVDRRAARSARTRPVRSAEPGRELCCVGCGHVITDDAARIEVAGRHEHTCVNPAGYAYRIACFRVAPGAVGVGSWSSYYSWFGGHVWQVACCGSCSMHLGWGFEPEHEPSPSARFHGLIRNRLRERAAPARHD